MTTDYILIADDINPSLYPVVVVRTTEAGRIEERVMGTQETQDYLASILGVPIGAAFNVADYGATGDGVTDDTVAIQAAFTAVNDAGGGVVEFLPGTYLITAQVNIYSPNVIMRGAGPSTIIKAKTNANVGTMFWVQSTADHFAAEDLVIDGNRRSLGTSGAYGSVAGIRAGIATHLTFTDLEVREVAGIGVNIQNSVQHTDTYATFTRVYAHDNGMLTSKEGNGVFVNSVDGATFTDCRFERNYGDPVGGQYAGGGISNNYQGWMLCENCTFLDNFNGGGQIGGGQPTDLVCAWTFANCRFALSVPDPHATNGIEFYGRYLTVSNCEFVGHSVADIVNHGDNSQARGRVIVTNSLFRDGYSGFEHSDTGQLQGILIANNRFANLTVGVAVKQGADAATNIIIMGNDFSQSVTTPIVDGGATDIIALGNLPSSGTNKNLRLGTHPASTATYGCIGLPNALPGAIMFRNAANSGEDAGLHRGGDDRFYLDNAHSYTGTDFAVAGTLAVSGTTINLATTNTPANAAATGTKGDIRWDASYFYICVATNTWHRTAHATW